MIIQEDKVGQLWCRDCRRGDLADKELKKQNILHSFFCKKLPPHTPAGFNLTTPNSAG
jgi:hypothetical protein